MGHVTGWYLNSSHLMLVFTNAFYASVPAMEGLMLGMQGHGRTVYNSVCNSRLRPVRVKVWLYLVCQFT